MRDAPIGGHGLFATRRFEAESILFEEYPIGGTAVAFFHHRNFFCANCLVTLDNRIAVECGSCKDRYCSEQCLHWSSTLFHHKLCRYLNDSFNAYFEVAKSISNEYYLVAANLLSLFPTAPWLHHFVHEEDESEFYQNQLMARHLSAATGEDIATSVLAKTVGMLRVNVLGIKSGDTQVGFGLYSKQSLLNHSSDPNCRCVATENPSLCAIEAISEILPDEELTIDYLGPDELGPCRTNILATQYNIGT